MEPTKMETLCGSVELQVEFPDKHVERVEVRQIKLRHMQRYASLVAISDEAAQIEMFTGKDAAWVDSLPNDAAIAILKEGQRINQDFFVSWAVRLDDMAKLLTEKMPKPSLPNTPPNSPANQVLPSAKPQT